jgi:hypothetical protein
MNSQTSRPLFGKGSIISNGSSNHWYPGYLHGPKKRCLSSSRFISKHSNKILSACYHSVSSLRQHNPLIME